MKILAAALTVTACAMAGQLFAARMRARVAALEAALHLLRETQAQLRFLALPAADLLAQLCRREALRPLPFLPRCQALTLENIPFPQAWRQALDEEPGALQPQDKAQLLFFGESIGATDIDGQLSACALCAELLEAQLQAAAQDCRKYGKLLPMLGLLGGAGIAILLY